MMLIEYKIRFDTGIPKYTFLEDEYLKHTGLEIKIDIVRGEIRYDGACFIFVDEWEDNLCLSVGHLQIDYLMSSFVGLCIKIGGLIDFEDALPPWAFLSYKDAKKYPDFVLISTASIKLFANIEFFDPHNFSIPITNVFDGMYLMGKHDSFDNELWFIFVKEVINSSRKLIFINYVINGYKIPDFSKMKSIELFIRGEDNLISSYGYLKDIRICP